MAEAAVIAAVFCALFAGHHVGDHVAQTDWQAKHKAGPGWLGVRAMAGHLLGYHACMVAALLGLVAAGVPLTFQGCAVGLVFSAVTHGFLDRRWPVRWILEHTGSRAFAASQTPLHGPYLADQSLHIVCLFVAALLVVGVGG
ncbi:DUF3307 domain-containing protein [Micromonospora sp. MED01]|uniref:DUF3307 domain-containing protein n=1 Tax=Micromonospora alfalfae TaxID=2911212 RepID=UPI001EE7D076|nr:DUF3307 domain-containing protein [Micromonospora alfalfae]MCG5464161.1 DUF3307 domain-containing protein [Micromonospora alfalfae]